MTCHTTLSQLSSRTSLFNVIVAMVQTDRTSACIHTIQERTSGHATWLTLPWLLVECVMYVTLATFVARQPLLASSQFDMFATAKSNGWKKCLPAATDLANAFLSLEKALQTSLYSTVKSSTALPEFWTAVSSALSSDTASSQIAARALSQAFADVLQWSLWGNKTDLSLHVDAAALAPAQVKQQQQGDASTASHQETVQINDPRVIVDNYPQLWSYLEGALQAGPLQRVDIILDNSGKCLCTWSPFWNNSCMGACTPELVERRCIVRL